MNILLLGDSFTFGHGCSDRVLYFDVEKNTLIGESLEKKCPSNFCWGSLIQKDFSDIIVYNMSRPGRSMQGLLADFVEFVEVNPDKKIDLVIYNSTLPDRIELPMVHDHNLVASWGITWDVCMPDPVFSTHPPELIKARNLYRKYLWNSKIGDQQSFSALMGAYAFALSQNIKFRYTLPLYCFHHSKLNEHFYPFHQNEIPALWSYDFSTREDKDFNKNFQSQCGHANDLGHQVYYQKVIKPEIHNIFGV